MNAQIITSIDLGSNSYRVLQIDSQSKEVLGEFETTVGLADGLAKTGDISLEALDRVIKAIEKSIDKLQFDPKNAIAVTTHAMRKAKNSQEILLALKDKTGVSFEIIDADTEAKLTLLAMQYALKREKVDAKEFFLLDIGGGSSELIFHSDKKQLIKSFPYGIVTLSQSTNKEEQLQTFKKDILEHINPLDTKEAVFLSTAGTPTTLAALKQGLNYKTYDKSIVNGTILNKEEVEKRKEHLKSLSKEELIKEVGSGRDDYIDAGISIYLLFFEVLKMDESIVFDDGLREGVALNSCRGFM